MHAYTHGMGLHKAKRVNPFCVHMVSRGGAQGQALSARGQTLK